MAIIKSSKNFEGGEFKQGGGSYIKPGVRVLNFRDKKYVDGTYVFILGAYREDAGGNGVWYKPLKIRDNFGMDTKEKFAVQPNCPVDYFANRVKTYAPNMSKVEKVKGEDGRDRNVYPAFGRTTWRVMYNAAHFDFTDGVHILDLPQSGGASVIDEYVRGKGPDGQDNPDITDYQAAIPVHIKLDLKASGQPWKIRVNDAKKYTLPVELADTEYLYNLEEAVMYPSKEELISKLKMIVPSDLFNKCMAGYTDGTVSVSFSAPAQSAPPALPEPPDDVPMNYPPTAPAPRASAAKVPTAAKPTATQVAPAFPLPKATIPQPRPAAAAPAPAPAEDAPEEDMPRPPVASTAATMDMAKQFLRRPQAQA